MGLLVVFAWLGLGFWDLLQAWLSAIFVAPFSNFDMLWVLIPIYLGWIVADFFQEKRGTSLSDAITNGVIPLWAGLDWIRTTIRYLGTGQITITFFDAATRFLLAACVLAYGIGIIYAGVKARPLTKYIGRIRTVSYFVILLTPVFYDVIPLSLQHILATILFFPLFYYAIELFDHLMPDPRSIIFDGKT